MSADRQELQGWDAISHYLGLGVRTCQEHAKKTALPIHRLPGLRGRVFAYSDQLDAWKLGLASRSSEQTKELAPPAGGGDDKPLALDTERRSSRRPISRIAAAAVGIGVILAGWLWAKVDRSSPPSDWRIAGRTLVILDSNQRQKWSVTFEHYPRNERGRVYSFVLMSDFNDDGRTEVLFVYTPLDERHTQVPNSHTEIHLFDDQGNRLWAQKFGTPFTMPSGDFEPTEFYHIRVLGRLRKPRADGGVIVVGGHRLGLWTYQVALYTADGKKVGEYLHPGWFSDMVIADLNQDGSDEIILGGVNNAHFEAGGSGATIVVLDSTKMGMQWQGPVPDGDNRQARGWLKDQEEAVLLIKEFAPHPNWHKYCRVLQMHYGDGVLEALVEKGDDYLPIAYFYFDRRLQLIRVEPDDNFGKQLTAKLDPSTTAAERKEFLFKELGKVRYLRNAFNATAASE